MKLNKLIRLKNESYRYFDENSSLKAVKENGFALQYVREQTEEICMEAVRQNGFALQYVREQTEEICMEAVRQNVFALQYVREQNRRNVHSSCKTRRTDFEICQQSDK